MEHPAISLKAARVNAGILLKDAAEHIHVAPETLRSYEKGKTEAPYGVVKQLAELYKFPIEYIFLPSSSA